MPLRFDESLEVVTIDQDDVAQVLLSYGADPEVLYEYNCSATRARLVRDVVKLRTPYGPWAFKKAYLSEEELEYVYQVTEHVAAYQSMVAPRFIHTRYGDPYILHLSGNYYVTAWPSGREPDLRKERHVVACAGVLSSWHTAAKGFTANLEWEPNSIPLTHRLSLGKDAILRLQAHFTQSPKPSAFQKIFLAGVEELLERVAHTERLFEAVDFSGVEVASRKIGSVCHGNFAKRNLLYTGDAYTVIGYESVRPGPPVYELALYLHRYLPSYAWQPDVLEAAVAEYERVAGYTPDFRMQLAALVTAPFRALQIVSWYLDRTVDWSEEDFVDALEFALELDEARTSSAMRLCKNIQYSGYERAPAGEPVVHASLSAKDLAPDSAHDTNEICQGTAEEPLPKIRSRRRKIRPQKNVPSRVGPKLLFSSVALRGADEHRGKYDEQEHENE